jgi:hypothetical protein
MSPLVAPLCIAISACSFTWTLAQDIPADVLRLNEWKLTLPIDTPRPAKPDEVLQPELATFSDGNFFYAMQSGTIGGVVFRAPCGGLATRGAEYPRTELREMNADGRTGASWGIADGGTHILSARLSITQVPHVKPHVICAQIHNEKEKLLAIRYEGGRLIAEGEGQKDIRLLDTLPLGTPLNLKIVGASGEIVVHLDDREKVRWKSDATGCYFKIGCYTQSNPRRGDRPDA